MSNCTSSGGFAKSAMSQTAALTQTALTQVGDLKSKALTQVTDLKSKVNFFICFFFMVLNVDLEETFFLIVQTELSLTKNSRCLVKSPRKSKHLPSQKQKLTRRTKGWDCKLWLNYGETSFVSHLTKTIFQYF